MGDVVEEDLWVDCEMVAYGLYWLARKSKQQHSTLAGRKTCKIHERKINHEVGRVYRSLKSFCLQSNHVSTPPQCRFLEEPELFVHRIPAKAIKDESSGRGGRLANVGGNGPLRLRAALSRGRTAASWLPLLGCTW